MGNNNARYYHLLLVPYIVASIFILSWCFSSEETGKKTDTLQDISQMSLEESEKIWKEDLRISKLSDLTEDNLKTQKEKDGKSLKDHRLFINYLLKKNIKDIRSFAQWMEEIEKFSKQNNIELTDSNLMIIIAGFRVASNEWKLCEHIDKWLKYAKYINIQCNPEAPTYSKK